MTYPLLPALKELRERFPDGAVFRQFEIYPCNKWKSYTNSSQIRDLKKYNPSWKSVEFVLIGGTDFGDAIVVTDADPISSHGAIYATGEMAGPDTQPNWPAGTLRLGFSISEWLDRVFRYEDEPGITPGSIDEELGERAEEYRIEIKKINPGLDW